MRPRDELVAYLNGYFAPQIWYPAGDLIGNLAVSQVDDMIRSIPLLRRVSDIRLDFTRPPSFTALDNSRLRLRIPGSGSHTIEGTVVTNVLVLPTIDLGIELALTLVASSGAPAQTPDIDCELGLGLLGLIGPALLPTKILIEEAAEEIIPALLANTLDQRLGGFASYRFQLSPDLAAAPGSAGLIVPAFPSGSVASTDPKARGYCDILVVADGFTAAQMPRFQEVVRVVREHFASTALESPFREMRSAIRLWQMPLVAANRDDRLERCVMPVAQGRTINFSNLARVAEIGLEARATFGNDPIIVFCCHNTQEDYAAAGIPTDAEQAAMDPPQGPIRLRSNCQGPYVMIDLHPSGSFTADAVDFQMTMIHELGHSPIGRYLADEYDDGNEDVETVYRGPEPRPRNVGATRDGMLAKWDSWVTVLNDLSGAPRFDPPFVRPAEGGYEHDTGIMRFRETCRMRESGIGEFCEICREELTLGLLGHSHFRAGSAATPGMMDIGVEILAPWSESRMLHLEGGDVVHLPVLATDPVTGPLTHVRLALRGASVPEPRQVTWTVRQSGAWRLTNGTFQGSSIDIACAPGATIDIETRHEQAPVLLTPDRARPTTTSRLLFDEVRRITADDLLPPTDLRQSPGVGADIRPVVDAAIGRLSYPYPLWLSADIAGVRGYSLATRVDFRLSGPGSFERTYSSQYGPVRTEVRWTLQDVLPAGGYSWSARTHYSYGVDGHYTPAPTNAAGLAFSILPFVFDAEPRAPAAPFDLQILETLTFPPLPRGLSASSWHPNDLPITFEFQTRAAGAPWVDPPTVPATGPDILRAGPVARNIGRADSLAVTGQVALPPIPLNPAESRDWRVRAIDERGRASAWVEGPRFTILLPAQRPKTLEELARLLDKVDRRILDPRGPGTGERLFLLEDGFGDGVEDLSVLAHLPTRPDRLRPGGGRPVGITPPIRRRMIDS